MKRIHRLMLWLEALLSPSADCPAVILNTTAAVIGYGSKLKRGDAASPENFTAIAEVTSIGEFGSERKLFDVTNFDSPDTFMEYLLAMKDGVELAVAANFLPANATQSPTTGIIKDHDDATRRNFQLVLPGMFGTFSFTGLVRAWKAKVEPNAAITATFTIKLTGAITYSA